LHDAFRDVDTEELGAADLAARLDAELRALEIDDALQLQRVLDLEALEMFGNLSPRTAAQQHEHPRQCEQ
jgi:hypothetical protein